jgi:hypothetical protein
MSERGSRRGWMLVLGVVILLVGIVGAGALWFAADARLDDNVAGLARAPSGCATTLDFDRTGEFTVFVETTGSLDDLAGDCAADTVYDRDDVADPVVVLVDPDGAEIEIQSTDGEDYDSGGFSGSSIGTIQIDVPGDHVLTVPADGAQFVIAVGGDPNAGVAPLRWGAVLLFIVALVVAGILLVLGSRRTHDTVDSDAAPWQPGALTPPSWPVGPPGFPAPPPTTGAVGPAGPPLVQPGSAPTGSPWAPPSAPSGDQ